MRRQPERPFIDSETRVYGIGPLNLDVVDARAAGWSEAAIERTAQKLSAIGKREYAIAHRKAPIATCRCEKCYSLPSKRK